MTEAIEAAEDGETVSAPDAYLAGMHDYFGIAVLARIDSGFDPAMKAAFKGFGLADMLH